MCSLRNEWCFQILEEEKDFILSCCQHPVFNESGSFLKQVVSFSYILPFIHSMILKITFEGYITLYHNNIALYRSNYFK